MGAIKERRRKDIAREFRLLKDDIKLCDIVPPTDTLIHFNGMGIPMQGTAKDHILNHIERLERLIEEVLK